MGKVSRKNKEAEKVNRKTRCTVIGKKRVTLCSKNPASDPVLQANGVDSVLSGLLSSKSTPFDPVLQANGFNGGYSMVSPARANLSPRTPKTTRTDDCESSSTLESLPMDILVLLARQCHPSYTTPGHVCSSIFSSSSCCHSPNAPMYVSRTLPSLNLADRQELVSIFMAARNSIMQDD